MIFSLWKEWKHRNEVLLKHNIIVALNFKNAIFPFKIQTIIKKNNHQKTRLQKANFCFDWNFNEYDIDKLLQLKLIFT